MQVREPAWELLREDGSCCGEIGCVGQRSGSSPALLLAVLTLQCAAKPYWWHGGQPAHAATYRVNVRMRGPTCRQASSSGKAPLGKIGKANLSRKMKASMMLKR